MKRFIVKILLFLLPAMVVAVIADYLISRTLRTSRVFASGEYPTWNDLYAGQINSKIVIYGSSRAWVQIDPSIVGNTLNTSCYNLGIDGQNFWAQYFRHQEFLQYNKKPNVIIQSLEVTTLTERGNLFNGDQFLPYLLYNGSMDTFLTNYSTFNFLDCYLPVVRYYGKRTALLHASKLFFSNTQDSGRIKGFAPQNLTWNNDLKNATSKFHSYEVAIDSSALELFKHYLEECRKHNINVILVYSPQYIEGQHFITNKDAIIALYRQLSSLYSLPFIDYSSDPISFDRANFYNSGHLNKTGATQFSKTLANDLREADLIR